jgi:Fic family protein
MLPAGIVNTVGMISAFRVAEEHRKAGYAQAFIKLESISKVQSVKASNAIEGIITTDKRIEAIVNENSAPLNYNEQEIAGYRDALAVIHEGYRDIDVREMDIKRLHAIMLSYTASGGGRYKQADNAIIEIREDGTRQLRFEPVSAEQTSEAMEQVILAYRDAQQNPNINQLLLISCFIQDFLCTHPFWNGNGRLSRLLSLLLLYKHGFDVGRYISFEAQINSMRLAYYDALREGSVGWHEGTNSYYPFMINFCTVLLFCYKELDKRFSLFADGKVSKSQRIEAVVLESLLPISKKEISYILPDVSMTTIEAVLAKLVKGGIIAKQGKGPATRYRAY